MDCPRCLVPLFEDTPNGVIVCVQCGLCSNNSCVVSIEYNYDDPLSSNEFIEKIGTYLDLSEQYINTCCEIFDDLNTKINFRGRTVQCIQGAIVYTIAPKYGYIISQKDISFISECTETELNSSIKLIKDHISISFNYEQALLRIAGILGIYIYNIQDFEPHPFDYTPAMDIYKYLVQKFPKKEKSIKSLTLL
tara:strand:- start:61 stop:639 length:579 start_codon:yes stop_codon:yes gene_type:complete